MWLTNVCQFTIIEVLRNDLTGETSSKYMLNINIKQTESGKIKMCMVHGMSTLLAYVETHNKSYDL